MVDDLLVSDLEPVVDDSSSLDVKLISRIFVIEDNRDLVASLGNVLGYEHGVHILDPKHLNPKDSGFLEYIASLEIRNGDYVIVDLNLSGYKEITGEPIKYSGLDILRKLDKEVENKYKGLEALAGETGTPIIVATSLLQEVNPGSVNPDIALLENIRVYGMSKGLDREGRVVDYGANIRSVIERIKQGKQPQLNE